MYTTDDFIPPDVACFGKRYVKQWTTAKKNYRTFDYWRFLLVTAATSRFQWEGLPDEVSSRYLELTLFGRGGIAFARRSVTDFAPYFFGSFAQIGNSDIYNDPVTVDIITPNGYRKRKHAKPWIRHVGNQYSSDRAVAPADCCICWDNLQRVPLMPYIDLQARRLALFDSVADQHVNSMRTPWLFSVPEEGKKNAEELFRRINSGDPAIYMNPNGLSEIQTSVLQLLQGNAYAGDRILNDRQKIVSDAYTMLGIDNNASAEKKERVQTSETLANNEQFLIQRRAALACRQEFADAVNAMFGLAVHVRWAVHHVTETEDGEQYAESATQGLDGGMADYAEQ